MVDIMIEFVVGGKLPADHVETLVDLLQDAGAFPTYIDTANVAALQDAEVSPADKLACFMHDGLLMFSAETDDGQLNGITTFLELCKLTYEYTSQYESLEQLYLFDPIAGNRGPIDLTYGLQYMTEMDLLEVRAALDKGDIDAARKAIDFYIQYVPNVPKFEVVG